MVKNHLSRLNAPKSWPIRRKGIKFIKRPNAGAHTLRTSIALGLLLTNVLKHVRTNKEVKKVLHQGSVLVNGVVRKDPAYPVGVMDIITIPSLNEKHRIVFNKKGKFVALALGKDEKEDLYLSVKDKTVLKKGKVQLNYSNGHTAVVEKDTYKTGDTVVLSLADKKIGKHLSFEKGATIYLTGGSHIGYTGTLANMHENTIVVKTADKEFETARRFAFVIGDLGVNAE